MNNTVCTGLCIPIPKAESFSNATSVRTSSSTTEITCLCGDNRNGTCSAPGDENNLVPPSFRVACPDDELEFQAPRCSNQALVNYTVQ